MHITLTVMLDRNRTFRKERIVNIGRFYAVNPYLDVVADTPNLEVIPLTIFETPTCHFLERGGLVLTLGPDPTFADRIDRTTFGAVYLTLITCEIATTCAAKSNSGVVL